MNINFNKIYLTKKFSILKLIDKNEFDVNELLVLLNKLSSLETESSNLTEEYQMKNKDLEELNLTYSMLLNANSILKSEINEVQKKLDILKEIQNNMNESERAYNSYLIYQTLLLKQYVFFILRDQILKYKEERSFKEYQSLLFNQYVFFILRDQILKYKEDKSFQEYQTLLFNQYVFFNLRDKILEYKNTGEI